LLRFLNSLGEHAEFLEDFRLYNIAHEAERVNWKKLLEHEQNIIRPILEDLIVKKKREFSNLTDNKLKETFILDFFYNYS
jgi:hypothetical protein